MYNIADFNSVLEVGFAVNAILVFFELESYLGKRFNKTQLLGHNLLANFIQKEEDLRYVTNYGWRSLVFGYAVWIGRLKWISVINSSLCLLLLIGVGYNPAIKIGFIFLAFLLFLIFIPVMGITCIIIYGLPRYKIACMEEALQKLIDRQKENLSEEEYELLKTKYAAVSGFIKITNFPFFMLSKPKKGEKLLNDFMKLSSEKHKSESANNYNKMDCQH